MRHFLTSFVGYSEGAVNVMFYDYDKEFKPGSKVEIRIFSQMKLTKISYCWDDGEKTNVRALLNHSWFKVCVPEVPGNKPILKIITEVQFKDGTRHTYEHSFEEIKINNMQ